MNRRRVAWVLGVVAAFGVAVLALAALRLADVVRDLEAAEDLVDAAGTAIEDGRITDGRADLAAAEELLVGANATLHTSPALDVIGVAPLLRQNLRAVRRSVGVALEVVAGGGRLLDDAAPLQSEDGTLEVPLRDGAIPLDVVVATAREAAQLAGGLPGRADVPDDEFLFGPVADAQERLYDEAVRRRAQLSVLSRGLALVGELGGADGPRRYLIAVANTAEMRGTGGMILSYGVLESVDGTFELPSFGPIDELFLDEAAPVDVPSDVLERWDGLEVDRLWRNANVVPDLDSVGPRLLAMYEAATGLTADGVIQIDAHGLAAVLEGVGPVTVAGLGEVGAANAVDVVLNTAYARFDDATGQRREVLGDLAEATFDRLVEGRYESLRPLAEALARAAAERHVILWTPGGRVAGLVAAFAADGELPDPSGPDHLLLTVQNFGRNKLDYYVDTAVQVRGERPIGEPSTLAIEVTVTNTAPRGVSSPSYVFGDGSTAPPGTYVGVASLYVPSGATLVAGEVEGTTSTPTLLPEGGRTVVGWDLCLPAGASATARLEVRLPPRPPLSYALALTPLPRVRPTTWDVEIDAGAGVVARRGPLVRPEVLLESAAGRAGGG